MASIFKKKVTKNLVIGTATFSAGEEIFVQRKLNGYFVPAKGVTISYATAQELLTDV